ncbi:MAG: redoxin domain-containing protein [Cyclobacteriaceae bacterium]
MKKISFLAVFFLVFTAPVMLITENAIGKSTTQPEQYTPKGLPDMPMLTTAGIKTNAQELEGKVVLVLFQPDCDHCQREAVQIREHLQAFDDYTVYFITYAPMADIQRFSQEYQLDGNDNVFFAFVEVQPILDNFGSVPTPSMYIYSDKRQLVKSFEGETPIAEILPHI